MYGGNSSGNQTITQQNIPDWAMDYAQNSLDMTKYFTNNPNYRPSTLDRDYSGIRGYNGAGQPNSQVGQYSLNPMPAVPPTNVGPSPQFPNVLPGIEYTPEKPAVEVFGKGQLPYDQFQQYQDLLNQGMTIDEAFNEAGGTPFSKNPTQRYQTQGPVRPRTGLLFEDEGLNQSLGIGRTNTGRTAMKAPGETGSPNQYSTPNTSNSGYQGVIGEQGSNITNDPDPTQDTSTYDNNNTNTNTNTNTSDSSSNSNTNNPPPGMTAEEVQAQIDQALQQFDENTITPDEMPTPFQAYDRQRFAAPGANTVAGESILAGRYGQRFGEGGTDPFAAANAAVENAAGFSSGYSGTMGTTTNLGGTSGGYRDFIGSPTTKDPGIFKAGDYTTDLTQYSNPNADLTNVNAGMANVNAGMQNVNAGMTAAQYGNANQGLQGPINYQQQRSLRDSMQQFQDPYTDQVVNQTIRDMDRARKMTANQISGDSAKAGAYGGSRSMLMQAENNRNFADRTAAAVGQLRSQGFQRAADLAQQENLQRLGLSASDVQQARGLQSQGNLQGQNLTANDLQNVRGLQSQGALAAQGLRSQGALAAQGLQSQGALTAQGLQSQGALAALNANSGIYQSGLGLNAANDRAAMQANAGLLSDAMNLDAADLNQRRSIGSNEAQFAETALRGAGALNLQGGQALGQLAQAGTADERQRIADMLAAGQAGDARNQQDLDFIYNEFNRELDYPGRLIDLRNSALSPATGSIVTTSQPRYEQSPLAQAGGPALAMYAATSNPYLAAAAAAYGLLS